MYVACGFLTYSPKFSEEEIYEKDSEPNWIYVLFLQWNHLHIPEESSKKNFYV